MVKKKMFCSKCGSYMLGGKCSSKKCSSDRFVEDEEITVSELEEQLTKSKETSEAYKLIVRPEKKPRKKSEKDRGFLYFNGRLSWYKYKEDIEHESVYLCPNKIPLYVSQFNRGSVFFDKQKIFDFYGGCEDCNEDYCVFYKQKEEN